MEEPSTTAITDVLTTILSHADQNRRALFASIQEHDLLQQAVDFARNGQAEQFFYTLPCKLERVTDGLLLSTLPGKPEAHFILQQYRFLNAHFQRIIQHREGTMCSGDKSSTILHRLLRYYLTGQEIVFDPDEKYTFGHPTIVFKTHQEIVEFFDGLRNLYYGNPTNYLKALQNTMENSDA